MQLVDFTVEMYYDARPCERQRWRFVLKQNRDCVECLTNEVQGGAKHPPYFQYGIVKGGAAVEG